MGQVSVASSSMPGDSETTELHSTAQFVHSFFRLVLAVRYRKNLVLAVMVATGLLGWLHYATAQRRYAAKAALLVTQVGQNQLNTSMTNEDLQRQNAMPTYENMIRSGKVLEGAMQTLAPADCVDWAGAPQEFKIARFQSNLTVKTIRSTSILEVNYTSKDPQVAVNIVRAVVQSYLNFMDTMHKGTASQISQMLTQERESVADKLGRKQQDLLECRRSFADMGFRSDGKTLHPMVQRAVAFNDALVVAQKQRVEHEALLATIHRAIQNGQDIEQYILSMGDSIGKELLLDGLGLGGGNNAGSQINLEQSLIALRAELQTAQQNLGPMHPEVVALTGKIALTERFILSAPERMNHRITELHKSNLGPWVVQMMQRKVDELRMKETVLGNCFEAARTEAINLSGQLAQIEMLERDVKRLGDMNDVLLNQIASLDLKQNGSEVRVAVIEEPVMVTKPVSPRLSRVVILVFFGGFCIALALVTLLDAVDDRFRSMEEIQGRLGLPLLAMIQRLEPAEKVGPQALLTHTMPKSVESEGFRTLRTALTLTHPDAHQIAITSAEPGDGKTTVLANLAVCYAQADKRTLLIDADMRRPGLTNLMNMRGPRGLSEVLRSEIDILQAAPMHIQPSGVKGLDILPSGSRPIDPAELLGNARFPQLLAWASTVYDQILIDSPPSLATTDTAIIGQIVDGVILVMQPAKNRRHLVMKVVERLTMLKTPLLGMVVNRTGSGEEQGYYGYHSYGYGYGYEYGYGKGEEGVHGEAATKPSDGNAQDSCLPLPDRKSHPDKEDENSRTPLTPRRVA